MAKYFDIDCTSVLNIIYINILKNFKFYAIAL